MNARLAWLDPKTGCERQRPRRMTAETTQPRIDRIEGAVNNICGTRVAGREGQRFRRGVITQAVFGDSLLAGLADPCNSFSPRAEGPLGVASGARIRCLGPPQSMCMRGLRLRFELRGMALPADRAAGISRTRIRPATGMAHPAITSAARHRREIIGVALAVTGIPSSVPNGGWPATSPSLSIGPQDTRTSTAAQAD